MPQDSYLTISSDASGVSELANRPRLLIVDDDPEMLSVLENLFLEQGYRVKTSTDGLEAMRMIGEESFDIIVTDIFMPGASGLQVLKQAKQLQPEALVIAIDEVQFFDDDVVAVCEELALRGKRVIVAGLDTDFRGEPFGPMPALLAKAESVRKLHAICMVCGGEASRTQRLIDGQPAYYEDPVVLIGASESYEARCRGCHQVPHRNASHTAT